MAKFIKTRMIRNKTLNNFTYLSNLEFFFKDFVYFCLERGKGKEKERVKGRRKRERNINV